MRSLTKKIAILLALLVPSLYCNNSKASYSSVEKYVLGATFIGIGYGVTRICAWIRSWETKKAFAQEIDQCLNLYRSIEEAQLLLQNTILIKHDNECETEHYRFYPLLWYKEQLTTHINRLKFWRIVTIGSSDWSEINKLINQLNELKNLVVTNYLYINEMRVYSQDLQRYNYVRF